MALHPGQCIQCGRNFWWTGDKASVPPCGGCGRSHTETDYRYAKIIEEREAASERMARRG